MKRKVVTRREFIKMAVVAAPAMVSSIRAVVKPQPSTEGAMTLARYGQGTATNQNVPGLYDDDLFILQTGYPVRDLFPIGRPGLASMIKPERGLFVGSLLVH